MGKVSRSFSIDEQLDELMSQREDVNWSGVANSFFQEFAASGQGTEAALSVRKEQIETELDEAKGRVRRLEAELDRVEACLAERRSTRRDVFKAFESLEGVDLDPQNPAVRRHAEKIGMAPEEFTRRYREWAGIEA